jgi:ferritin heavy chain
LIFSTVIFISIKKISMATSSQNFLGQWTKDCEKAINDQINVELGAFYAYTAMGNHFKRNDVALENIGNLFLKNAEEEREHAQKLIEYNHKRGGNTTYQDIKAPSAFSATFTALDAMEKALDMEIEVNESLLRMHKHAANDPAFSDFIEGHFLHEQVEAINEYRGYITNLKMCGPGLGTYLFNKQLGESS